MSVVRAGANPPLVQFVFQRLADGEFHSGSALADHAGVSRSAIWKAIGALRESGASVEAVTNRGYRLHDAIAPLDAKRIDASIDAATRARVQALEVEWSVASTNATLLGREPPPPGHMQILLAENQTAGRGRRGRGWIAPLGGAICLSIAWTFAGLPRDLSALSLAVGVCAWRALGRHGAHGIGLKWPNDLLVGGRKLGGILIEMHAEFSGPVHVVIGLGLNVALEGETRERVEAAGTAPADFASVGLEAGQRNEVVAALVDEIAAGLVEFEASGLRTFSADWQRSDVLRGREIAITHTGPPTRGMARGIDTTGALLVETPRGLMKFIVGEVSVRTAA